MSAMSFVDVTFSLCYLSLRYPQRLGCCSDAPPAWAGVRLPPHGQPWLVRSPPVLPAADHAGLPVWSRSALHKLTEESETHFPVSLWNLKPRRNFQCHASFERKIRKKPPCAAPIAAQYLMLNSMQCTTKTVFSWRAWNAVHWPEILCSQEIGFFTEALWARRSTGYTIEARVIPGQL